MEQVLTKKIRWTDDMNPILHKTLGRQNSICSLTSRTSQAMERSMKAQDIWCKMDLNHKLVRDNCKVHSSSK